MNWKIVVAACLGLAGAGSAPAKPVPSPLVQALAGCRAQLDDAARLRCYDAAASALTDASARGEVVVLDRAEVGRTRRSLFGFNLPKLPFFGGDESAAEPAEELAATVASAQALPNGKWRIKIDGGAVWETTEASLALDDPRAGDALVIKRGPLGSYMIRIAGQRGVRGKRVG